jgi:hypothetical protein
MYAFKSSGIKLRDDHYYGYRDFRSYKLSANGEKGESQFQTNREDKTKTDMKCRRGLTTIMVTGMSETLNNHM